MGDSEGLTKGLAGLGTTNNYERIRISLEQLRSALDSYVELRMKEAFGDGWHDRYAVPDWSDAEFVADVQVLANTMINNWDEAFGPHLHRETRHLVHQVRKTRNRLAHQESFDSDDTYSALHEMQRLLEAVGSEAAHDLERSKNELLQDMVSAGESAEDVARKAEEAADVALAEGAQGSPPMLVLVREGQVSDVEFALDLPAIIGRADSTAGPIDVDLSPYAETGYVSRQHARITLEDGAYMLEDLGSSNGTFIKRDQFEKIEKAEICDGDEVAFGNARFVFRV